MHVEFSRIAIILCVTMSGSDNELFCFFREGGSGGGGGLLIKALTN